MMKKINLKNKWQKFPTSDKTIIILFLVALVSLIAGVIMLLSVNLNQGIFNGFNLVHNLGVIDSFQYYEAHNLVNLVFLKIGIVLTIFIMPIFGGISILWFIINRLFF